MYDPVNPPEIWRRCFWVYLAIPDSSKALYIEKTKLRLSESDYTKFINKIYWLEQDE